MFERIIEWWKEVIYYPVWRFWNYKVLEFPSEIKWFIQRGRRGFSDRDCWSIDNHLSTVVPQMLRHLAEHTHGVPQEFSLDEDGKAWKDKLREIADGLEAWNWNDDNKFELASEEFKKLHVIITERYSKANWLEELNRDDEIKERYYELYRLEEQKAYERWEKAFAEYKKYFGHFWD